MNNECKIHGCKDLATDKFCDRHSQEINRILSYAKSSSLNVDIDDLNVDIESVQIRINNSEEIKTTFEMIFETSIKEFSEMFPDMKNDVIEQLAGFQAMSSISLVISEKLNTLIRMIIFANSLPKEISNVMYEYINIEIDLLDQSPSHEELNIY